ncbi:MAG: hypothetical protein AAGH38_00030 [Pseudomonadota bacterium]
MMALRTRSHTKTPPPFSIRFTEAERAFLEREAGDLSISAYIRRRLFDGAMGPQRRNVTRKPKRPDVDRVALSRALASLGQSRLSQNLNQIAKAANMGALPVTSDLIDELIAACEEIRRMRADLIAALGLKPEGDQ